MIKELGPCSLPARAPNLTDPPRATTKTQESSPHLDDITLDYLGRDGTLSARRVEPHNLAMMYGRWYLVAHDLDREDWRMFRADRIQWPLPTGRRFIRRELPALSPGAYLADRISTASYRFGLEGIVQASADTVLARMSRLFPGRVEAIDEHSCRVRLGSDTLEIFAQCLVAFDADFAVTGSPEVVEYLRTVGQRLAAAGT